MSTVHCLVSTLVSVSTSESVILIVGLLQHLASHQPEPEQLNWARADCHLVCGPARDTSGISRLSSRVWSLVQLQRVTPSLFLRTDDRSPVTSMTKAGFREGGGDNKEVAVAGQHDMVPFRHRQQQHT